MAMFEYLLTVPEFIDLLQNYDNIFYALEWNNVHIFDKLLEYNVSVNKIKCGMTPIMYLFILKTYDDEGKKFIKNIPYYFDKLLKAGADINLLDDKEKHLLDYVLHVTYQDYDVKPMISKILDRIDLTNVSDDNKSDMLFKIIVHTKKPYPHINIIPVNIFKRYFDITVKLGLDINKINKYGNTLFDNIVMSTKDYVAIEVIEYLLQNRAVLKNTSFAEIMRNIDRRVSYECVEALIKYGADVNEISGYVKHSAIIELLLSVNDGPNLNNCVKLLIRSGINTKSVDATGKNILMACIFGFKGFCDGGNSYLTSNNKIVDKFLERVDILLDHVNVNDTDKSGKTALMYALELNFSRPKELIKKLLKKGANTELVDNSGITTRTYLEKSSVYPIKEFITLFDAQINNFLT
jgi:ankyrin repeat protein